MESAVAVPGSPDPASNPATQTLEIDHSGRFLLAANYTANTVLVYALNADGSVGSLVSTREDGLNAHHTVLNVSNKFALVPYLGSNFIAVYKFDDTNGSLTPHVPFTTNIPIANSGPRHLAIHPNTRWVYAIARRDGRLTPIQFQDSRGATPRQFSLSPGGDLLVVGNQGSNNMSVFKVSSVTGMLSYVATTPVCSIPFFARMVAR